MFYPLLFSCTKENEELIIKEAKMDTSYKIATYTTLETDIINLINEHRITLGLSTLNELNIISSVADSHTNYMIQEKQISHDYFNDRSNYLKHYTNAITVAENVGFGYNSAQGVVTGWLNSTAHKNIIENPSYTHVGISTAKNSDKRNYFTQIFIMKE